MLYDSPIEETNIDIYEGVIPEEYIDKIRDEKLFAAAVYDGDDFFGIYLTDIQAGWLEIVWAYIDDPDKETVEKAAFFRHLIGQEKKKRGEDLKGAFIEFYEDEAWKDLSDAMDVLSLAGFTLRLGEDNCYEFALSDVKSRKTLQKAAEKIKCMPLSEAQEKIWITEKMEEIMLSDDRPVPVPAFIYWEDYLQDLSFISILGGEPCGAVLVTQEKDYLVVELAYTANPVVLPALLWNALEKAEEKYGSEKRVLVPVVVNKTADIVEHMVPDAKRGKLINGFMWF